MRIHDVIALQLTFSTDYLTHTQWSKECWPWRRQSAKWRRGAEEIAVRFEATSADSIPTHSVHSHL